MTFRKRALVALALALSLVVSAAAPSGATVMQSDSENRSNLNKGRADLDYGAWTGSAYEARVQMWAEKLYAGDGSDKWTCTETWVDQRTYSHRPPDVSVNCRTGAERTWGLHQMHYVNSSGNPVATTLKSNDLGVPPSGAGIDVMVCRVDIRTFNRDGSNCQGTGVDLSDKDDNDMSWSDLPTMNNLNEPEFADVPDVDTMWYGATLYTGDILADLTGGYVAAMQADGNFVVYNRAGTAVWAAGSCLAAGKSLVAGSRITPQTDGNLVIYSPTNQAVWASANINSCTHGSYGSGHRLTMQNDGNLVLYSTGGSALWASSW